MNAISQVNTEIISVIKAKVSTISFTAEEILEKIPRPSFKIAINDFTVEKVSLGMLKRAYTVRLIYFASDIVNTKSECLGVYDNVEKVLLTMSDKLTVAISAETSAMGIEFELSQIDDYSTDVSGTDTAEPMETLALEE